MKVAGILFALLIFKIVNSYDEVDYYSDYSEQDDQNAEISEEPRVTAVDAQVIPNESLATTESKETKLNESELDKNNVKIDSLCLNTLVQLFEENTESNDRWKKNLESEVKTVKRVVKKLMKTFETFPEPDYSARVNDNFTRFEGHLTKITEKIETMESIIIFLSNDFKNTITSMNEVGFSCKTDPLQNKKSSNTKPIMEKINGMITGVREDLNDFKSVLDSFSNFRLELERVLHRNQNQFWLRLLAAIEDLQDVAVSMDELVGLQKSKSGATKPRSLITKATPSAANTVPPIPSRSEVEHEPPQGSSEILVTSLDENDGVQNIGCESSGECEKPQNTEDALEVESEDLLSTNNGSNLFDLNTDDLRVGSPIIAANNSEVVEGISSDGKVFNREELLKRPKRKISKLEITPLNVAYAQRVSFEMEQLAKCLDLSVEKYNEMVAEMKEQKELTGVTKKLISEADAKIVVHTWMERGFFIFTGFLTGILMGTISTVVVYRCAGKSQSSLRKRSDDVEMNDLKSGLDSEKPTQETIEN